MDGWKSGQTGWRMVEASHKHVLRAEYAALPKSTGFLE